MVSGTPRVTVFGRKAVTHAACRTDRRERRDSAVVLAPDHGHHPDQVQLSCNHARNGTATPQLQRGCMGKKSVTTSQAGIRAGRMTLAAEENDEALDVAGLVRQAAAGDRLAWERLVDQYERLIWAVTRDFKLLESDAADVFQVTWLRLLEHINKIEKPDRVGAWLAATARNECLRCLAARKRVILARDDIILEKAAGPGPEIDEGLLSAERSQMVREALANLPWRWQRMLELLMADPPASYAEISDQIGLPIGSIGPTRNRCLARLRVLLLAS